jgi:hypothetical protein
MNYTDFNTVIEIPHETKDDLIYYSLEVECTYEMACYGGNYGNTYATSPD